MSSRKNKFIRLSLNKFKLIYFSSIVKQVLKIYLNYSRNHVTNSRASSHAILVQGKDVLEVRYFSPFINDLVTLKREM